MSELQDELSSQDVKESGLDSAAAADTGSDAGDSSEAKITVRFRPMGATRRLQTTVFKVPSKHQFAALVTFLRRQLKFTAENSLFCYINASFSPALDANLHELAGAYAVEGVLNIYYCGTVAFG